jgi:hypothetical protein
LMLRSIISGTVFAIINTAPFSYSVTGPIVSNTSTMSNEYLPYLEKPYAISIHDLMNRRSVATGW